MQNKIQEFHTGLFLDSKKRRVLLANVQDLLRNHYHLVAVTGPQLSNHTSEVLLRPLGVHPLGVNVVNAQVLLAKYLSMVKDSRPKMFSRKEPELIDLESSDDEAMDEASVIIDLDESDISGKGENSEVTIPPSVNLLDANSVVESHDKQNSPSKLLSRSVSPADASKDSQDIQEKVSAIINVIESEITIVDSVKKSDSSPESPIPNIRVDVSKCSQDSGEKSTPIINMFDSDIIFVDLVKQNSPPKLPPSNNDTGDVLKDSNKQGKKRKKCLEKENAKDVEVVEILDNDIIVLDDTLPTYNADKACSRLYEPEVSVVEHSTENKTVQALPQRENLSNSCTTSRSNTTSCLVPQPDTSQSTSVQQNVTKCSENESENSNSDNTLNLGPPKKKSKLAYHRPAHLVTPLTQSTPAVPSTKIDSNIYNPNADSTEKRSGLRPIVIDGNNVAIGNLDLVNVFGSHGKGSFSLKGIQICINFFEKRGHRQIKVFIPQYRRNRDNHDELQKMERKGLIVITPSRKVNGKVVASYDDRYIVQYAAEFGGVIVSTDNFRDLLSENDSWRETIENRLLMFTWVDDLLMFPQDPLGRKGPSLDDFLKFPDT